MSLVGPEIISKRFILENYQKNLFYISWFKKATKYILNLKSKVKKHRRSNNLQIHDLEISSNNESKSSFVTQVPLLTAIEIVKQYLIQHL